MSKKLFYAALLTLGLLSCGPNSTPTPTNPTLDNFFSTQPTFDGTLPAAQTVTPDEFMAAVQAGAKPLTGKDLADALAAEQAQNAQDDQDAATFIAAHPDFAGLLDKSRDAERLVTVDTDNSKKKVVLMGNQFGRSVLANHARTYATRENQRKLYGEVFNDLSDALKQLDVNITQFGLPAPDETARYTAAQLLEANRKLANVALEYRTGLVGVRLNLEPSATEVGAADQLDRTQKGPCETASNLGLLRNLDWPLKAHTTSVKDQGQRGTCWGFATIAALEAEIARRDRKLVNLSEQDYVGHRLLEWAPRAYGDGGDPLYIAQKASAANYVFPLERGWQYNKSNVRIANDKTMTYMNSCSGYQDNVNHFGTCSDTNDQGHLQTVLYLNKKTGKTGTYLLHYLPNTGSPSGYRMASPTDFWDWDNKDRSLVILLLRSVLGHSTTVTLDMRYVAPDANGYAPLQTMNKLPDGKPDFELNHVMTVTGFISSDTLRKAVPNAPIADDYGYFIVKNSWGDCWGDQGYVYLPWTWMKTFVGQASTGIIPQ